MKILVTGGGTGGHIYPALALIKRIKEVHKEAEFLYVGTERGLESTIVPKAGVSFKALKVEGFKRKLNFEGIVYNLKTIGYFIRSIHMSKKLIASFRPDIVIGTGGYVSAPVCYAAAKVGVKTIVHEQNSVAGVTNKFLARYVSAIAICFEDARTQFKGQEEKVIFTGNPRAQEVAHIKKNDSLRHYGLDPEKPSVLIFGGSRGAAAINQVVMDSRAYFPDEAFQVLFVTGEANYERFLKEWTAGKELAGLEKVKIVPYVDSLPEVFASVSLVVARSGATTLAELTAIGVPSILIPSPNVTEDHQTRNARSLSDAHAALLLKESELNSDVFMQAVSQLMKDEPKRLKMAQQAKEIGVPDASDRIIQLMIDLIRQ
ncbi:UDP-N-acetylglucosamine--N-acetylmuramyl- (pentapeptide) pyrophosphoryl-undecaprenol N-acetylglucosamine transferase [Alkalibacterium sp. AK22]|uniref:undecaprenyldiphospho-muramoylpentapeptide beta-N-acetylglucosaminyltransferase n=1 Tax=Alkalibacterium sp. AK22 TaxID=1229520 RepID=UPI000450E7BF|nr:undecaprenyldiphospho-muramoylpentapeptide beta-N-acetylglucosaminyltransferase [Alkalibacterium sp. AK22]EXJ22856.1 UDP-N-acetylglucosamine--N-acetylmuramyl- (pentapeptide) pyrophosphoryl-undecaprenol N-acetylglucosamine transferase [Alkalibacterium sp. AK22]